MSRRHGLPCIRVDEQYPTQADVVRIHGTGWRCTRCAAWHPGADPFSRARTAVLKLPTSIDPNRRPTRRRKR